MPPLPLTALPHRPREETKQSLDEQLNAMSPVIKTVLMEGLERWSAVKSIRCSSEDFSLVPSTNEVAHSCNSHSRGSDASDLTNAHTDT